jgi:hypothetical protein
MTNYNNILKQQGKILYFNFLYDIVKKKRRDDELTTTLMTLTEYLPIIIYVLITILISYFITKKIAKNNKLNLLILPGIFLILTIVTGTFGMIVNDWGALGYLIIAALSLGALIGSLISSLIVYLTVFKRKD